MPNGMYGGVRKSPLLDFLKTGQYTIKTTIKTGQNYIYTIAKTGQVVYCIIGGVDSCIEKIPLLLENG